MEGLEERAARFAEEDWKERLTGAISEAYKYGYNDGYYEAKDGEPCASDIDDKEYIDLGLPSGTLWSNDFVRKNGEIQYFPFAEVEEYGIPTLEQWQELTENCIIMFKKDGNKWFGECIGLNGKSIILEIAGFKHTDDDKPIADGMMYFWLDDEAEDEKYRKCAKMWKHLKDEDFMKTEADDIFMGFKLPVRLVKANDDVI